MRESMVEPVGAILAPSHMRTYSRGRENLEDLSRLLGGLLPEVYCSVPYNSPINEEKAPDDTPIIDDKLPIKEGPLVGFYSVLDEINRPTMFLRSDCPIPTESQLTNLLEIWRENKELEAVYYMDYSQRVPFPVIVSSRVTKQVRRYIRVKDPSNVEFFLRSIQSRRIKRKSV